jgi:hypothetical protein
LSALYKGLEPGLHRQVINGGLRIGLYDPVKKLIVGKDHVGDVPLLGKIGAGLATGAIAICVASPTDLVKVRMQGEGKLPPGVPRRYSGAVAAYGIIAREEGLTGLWKGLGPNVARNAIINAAELASYDQIKQSLLATGYFTDNVVTHLVSGLGAGFFAVSIGSPVDVVKSRVMGEFFVLLCVRFAFFFFSAFSLGENERRQQQQPPNTLSACILSGWRHSGGFLGSGGRHARALPASQLIMPRRRAQAPALWPAGRTNNQKWADRFLTTLQSLFFSPHSKNDASPRRVLFGGGILGRVRTVAPRRSQVAS